MGERRDRWRLFIANIGIKNVHICESYEQKCNVLLVMAMALWNSAINSNKTKQRQFQHNRNGLIIVHIHCNKYTFKNDDCWTFTNEFNY